MDGKNVDSVMTITQFEKRRIISPSHYSSHWCALHTLAPTTSNNSPMTWSGSKPAWLHAEAMTPTPSVILSLSAARPSVITLPMLRNVLNKSVVPTLISLPSCSSMRTSSNLSAISILKILRISTLASAPTLKLSSLLQMCMSPSFPFFRKQLIINISIFFSQ